jgi:hypothetical protein
MPRFLAFLPCERVVVASDDQSISLFSIVQGITATQLAAASSDEPHPSEDSPATLPIRWSIFVLWQRLAEDEGVTYESRVQLLSPSGNPLVEHTSELALLKNRHRYTMKAFGFPYVGKGQYLLRLSLRTLSPSTGEFNTIAEYPIDGELTIEEPVASKVSEKTARN